MDGASASPHCPAPPAGPYVVEAQQVAPEQLAQTEWILATGHGGFAMGSASGVLGRQYHTLLNAASTPPVGRVATVSRVEDTVSGAGGEGVPLALVRFSRRQHSVVWQYEGKCVRLAKALHVGWHSNTAALQYSVEAEHPMTLELRPRFTLRDFHLTLADHDAARFSVEEDRSSVRVEADGYAVKVACDGGSYHPGTDVTPPVDYAISRAREDIEKFGEPLWSPGLFRCACGPGQTVITVAFALAPEEPDFRLPSSRAREEHMRAVHAGAAKAMGSDLVAQRLAPLIEAADDFLVTRRIAGRSLMTVLAGYPWFADWGRDTMISLPGLMLTTGRLADARSCLEVFASFVSEGMVPNRLDDNDESLAHYNTVDASLWFLHAVGAYAEASGETLEAGCRLLQASRQIIAGYERGTRYDIRVDPEDGLVCGGSAATQLTWMDALRDGVAFTPRFGKCVEINALWHNGLVATAALLEREEPKAASELRAKAERVARSFSKAFLRPDGQGLYDCLRPGDDGGWTPVGEIRPNQLFAVSLPASPLAGEHAQAVVDVCRRHLLTPAGLRTLSPEDSGYRGRFKGNMFQRDRAYHNGTVWPWLLGPYCEALLRAGGFSAAAQVEASAALAPVLEHLRSGCLGQLAEVYDGDEPRAQEGCAAQAWSVAEVLRIVTLLATA